MDPDGIRRPGPESFTTKREAEQWLSYVEIQMLQGDWLNPDDQRVPLAEFGYRWIKERPGLSPRTVDLYRSLFANHIEPHLGKVALGYLDPARVRRWRTELLDSGVSATMTAKAYRLLRAILTTAVDDGILSRNPCRIRGAGSEPIAERPVLTVDQVFDLAGRLPDPYGLLVLVTTFGSLRWGEVTALRRSDVDTTSGTVRISSAFVRRYSGEIVRGAPKSRAGRRVVILPGPVVELLAAHLNARVGEDSESLIFAGEKGGPLHRGHFNKLVGWERHVAAIGAPGLHFHDLRHTGNTLAAMTGASLRDLMTRMGHDSVRAALMYQHNTQGADRKIADALEAVIAGYGRVARGLHDQDTSGRLPGGPDEESCS